MMAFDPILLHAWLGRSARRHPTKETIVCGKDRWTYAGLNSCSDCLAEALIELGVSRHDRVVIVTGNCPETVTSLYGTLKAGGVFVVLEGTTRARRLRYVLENCGPKALIASTAQGPVVADALYQVLMAIMFGGTVVLEQSFIFLHDLLKRVAIERVTGFPVVPTMLAMVLGMDDLAQYDLSCLRYITNTGAALPVDHIRRLQKLLPHGRIFSMFGLTECKRMGYLEPTELDRRPHSVGKAMPNCEVSIVDEDNREVGPGDVGELVVRGSNAMQGYWGDAEATARAYHAGPYPASRQLRSGDYFKRDDDGFLYFPGRKDDMIKTRGERVAPKEVENVICELSDVCEVAVVPVPDDVLGPAIKAFVVAGGGNRDEKSVLRHCHNNLERFMIPKQ